MTQRSSLRLLVFLVICALAAACAPRRGGGNSSDDDDAANDDDSAADDDDTIGDDDDAVDDDDTTADDDDAVDDDDTIGDDDDAVDDDDTTGDDDDSTSLPPPICPGGTTVVNEIEPNDETNQQLGTITNDTCIVGFVTCGEESYEDNDLFEVSLPSGTVTTTLSWSTSADIDAYLYEGAVPTDSPMINYQEGMTGPEVGTVSVTAGSHLLQVACWDGTDSAYILVVDI